MLGKISIVVTGLRFNIRIFIILARMEVVITYRAAWDKIVSPNSVLDMLIYKRVLQSQDGGTPVQSSIQCLVQIS